MSNLLVLPILFILIYQDFTKYTVTLFLLILLIIVQLSIGLRTDGWEETATLFVTNATITIVQLLMLKIYFRARKVNNSGKLINNVIGLGDIIFFLFLCMAFSPMNYIAFMIISLILTLLVHIIVRNRFQRIPLIGYLSIWYTILAVTGFNTRSDMYLQNLFF